MTASRPTVVALRALGLGDLLTAMPALRAIAGAFPDHRRVLAGPRHLRDLALLSGAVHEVVDTAPLAALAPELRHADVAVNLHGCGPESTRRVCESAPGGLIAFACDDVPSTAALPAWDHREHEVERWCRLLRECGIPADRHDLVLDEPPATLPRRHVNATIIHPGASTAARRWPPERWGAIARQLDRDGHRVVVTGTAGEHGICARVVDTGSLAPTRNLAGRTTLLELSALVAKARVVLTGDTGTAHLATAFATPSVVLFGPDPPSRWGPPLNGPHRVLWRGERGDPRSDRVDPGLLRITVAEVMAEIAELCSG